MFVGAIMRIAYTPLLVLAFCARLHGQGFVNTFGGQRAEFASGAAPLNSGFIAGTTRSISEGSGHQAGFLVVDASGNFPAWEPVPGLSGRSFMQAVASAADGGSYMAGSMIAPGSGTHDGFVARFSSTGALLWLAQPQISGDEQFFAVHALPDGGCIAAGVRSLGQGLGHDALVSRFGTDGSQQWSTPIDEFSDIEAHAIAVQGNDVMLTGRQQNFGGTSDAWIARLDLDGAVAWTSSWGGVRNETGRAIMAIGPGAFLLAGTTNSDVPLDITENRRKDHVYLVAFDLNGDSLWTRAIGDTLFDRRAFALDAAPNGDLLIAGERSATSGASDAFAYRLSPSGAFIWERAWDTGDEERLLSIRALPDGLISAGWSFGAASHQVLLLRRDPNGN